MRGNVGGVRKHPDAWTHYPILSRYKTSVGALLPGLYKAYIETVSKDLFPPGADRKKVMLFRIIVVDITQQLSIL